MPPPRSSRSTPRGSVDVVGDERLEVVDAPAASRSAPEPEQRRGRARRGPPRPAPRRPRAPGPSRSTATSRSPARSSGSVAAGQRQRRLAGTDEHRSEGPAGRSSDAGVRRRRPQQRLAGRDADDRAPQAVGQALGGRDPDAQPGERARAGADDDAAEPRPPQAGSPAAARWRAAASRRGGSRPARSAASLDRRRRTRRAQPRPGSSRCRCARSVAVPAVGRSCDRLEVAPVGARRPGA